MIKSTLTICDVIYYYKDTEVCRIASKSRTDKQMIATYLHFVTTYWAVYKSEGKEDALKYMTTESIPKPTTFPKFSNEIPFKIKWDKKWKFNQKIIDIMWTGKGWEYQIEGLGHKHDYQKESNFKLVGA